MKCEEFEKALDCMMDNNLTISERDAMSVHREECRDCQKDAHWYEVLGDLLSADYSVEVPAGFTGAVMAKIEELPAYRKPVFDFTHRSVGYAMAASVAGLVFFSWNLFRPSEFPAEVSRPVIEIAQSSHQQPVASQKPDLKLLMASGEVEVYKKGAMQWLDVSEDLPLQFEDRIRTLSNSSAHLVYEDGTELKLKPNSMIQVENDGVRVFHGDSWIKVVKKGKSFTAYTPNMVASVRGTMYDVSVRYQQPPYEEFISQVSMNNLFLGISPEIYFREFSLDALDELSSLDLLANVDTKVRVFESKVWVARRIEGKSQGDGSVVVPEGFSVSSRSKESFDLATALQPLTPGDYRYWELPAEMLRQEDSTVPSSGAAVEKTSQQEGAAAKASEPSVSSDIQEPDFKNLHQQD